MIYANGSEYVPGKSYNLYVFPHQIRLLDGDTIPAMSGFPIQVAADANGKFFKPIWTPGSGNAGKYDIIVDYDGDGKYSQPVNNIAIDAADGQFADFGFEVMAAPAKVLRIPVYYEDPWGGTHPVPPGTFAKVSKWYKEAITPTQYEEWLEMNLRVNEDSELVFETGLKCELWAEKCNTSDAHKVRIFLESYITAIEPGEGPNDQEVYLMVSPNPAPALPTHRFASSLFCIEGVGGNVWMPVGGRVIIPYDDPQSTVIKYDASSHQTYFFNKTGALAAMDRIHKGYHYMRGLDPSLSLSNARVTAAWTEGKDWHDEPNYAYLPDNTTCYAPKIEGSSVMRLIIDGEHFDEWSEVYTLQGYANAMLFKHGPIEMPVITLSRRDPIDIPQENRIQVLINAFCYYLPTTILSFPAILQAPASIQTEPPRGIDNEMAVLNFLKAINDPALIWNALAHPVLTPPAQNYPNPVNPETFIPFTLESMAEVRILIYDLAGQLVRSLEVGSREKGAYLAKPEAAYWDGKDEVGREVASGVYFYQLQAGGKTFSTKRMIVLK